MLLAGLAAALAAIASASATAEAATGGELRVCADPNNLPFSNQQKAGFENKLADLVARELGETVSYTWWAQRRGFVRNTLNARKCDVVMGVPVGYDLVETTRPYYRSGYVLVTRRDRPLEIRSLIDPQLRSLKIGVQILGASGFNTPPAEALAQQGIVQNVVGFTVYGDYRTPNPPAEIVDSVSRGIVDIAAVWGPLAGYFAQRSSVPLRLTPIGDTQRFAPLRFDFDMAFGVRKGDHQLHQKLDEIIARNEAEIARILTDYNVPTEPLAAGDLKPRGHVE